MGTSAMALVFSCLFCSKIVPRVQFFGQDADVQSEPWCTGSTYETVLSSCTMWCTWLMGILIKARYESVLQKRLFGNTLGGWSQGHTAFLSTVQCNSGCDVVIYLMPQLMIPVGWGMREGG